MKKSLLTLLVIAIAFIILKVLIMHFMLGSWINQTVSLLYLWSPGFIALAFARKENIALPIFRGLGKGYFLIPFYSFLIVACAFLIHLFFGGSANLTPILVNRSILSALGYVILLFFSSYVLSTILLGILFFGGELYWRGYLWEKLQPKGAMKAIWITALIWVIWQLPVVFLSYSPGLESVALNFLIMAALLFILSPVLFYFRLRFQSILAPSCFYASLFAAFGFLMTLLPVQEKTSLIFYILFISFGLVIFSLIFKLYSSSTWEKLKNRP